MTGIDGIGRRAANAPSAGAKRPRRVASPCRPNRQPPATPQPRPQTEAVALTSMLSLQEFGGETRAADREARRHGQDMLAALAELQRALLGGGDTVETLQRLAELAAAVPRAADPRLAALVSAIILRVRVELARRGV